MNQQSFAILQPPVSQPTTLKNTPVPSSSPSYTLIADVTQTSSSNINQIQFITKTGDHCINKSLTSFQIKIQVKCCGLSKLDSQVRKGTFPLWKNYEKNSWIIPGYEVSGIISQVGSGVNSRAFTLGDSVVGFIPVVSSSQDVDTRLEFIKSDKEDNSQPLENIIDSSFSEEYSSYGEHVSAPKIDLLNGGCSTELIADAHFFVKIPTGMSYIKASSSILCGIRAYDVLFYKCNALKQGDIVFITGGARWEQTYLLQLAITLLKCKVITTVQTDEEINFLRMISSRIMSTLSQSNENELESDDFTNHSPSDNESFSPPKSENKSYLYAIHPTNPLTILDLRLLDTDEKLQEAIMKETSGLGVQGVVLGEGHLSDSANNNKRDMLHVGLTVLSTQGTIVLTDRTDQLMSSHMEIMLGKALTMAHVFEQTYVQNTNLIGRFLRKYNYFR